MPVYLKAVKGAEPLTPVEHELLEDYLFGAIATAAGAQQLVVHIHTGNGDGPYFNNGNANPALLEEFHQLAPDAQDQLRAAARRLAVVTSWRRR